jgi:hypothetical protein
LLVFGGSERRPEVKLGQRQARSGPLNGAASHQEVPSTH